MTKTNRQDWLLVFYSVPSHPVSNRMKIWRKLAKTGAVQLKGAVYVLPAGEEHEELFQWLIGEVKAMGGDGAYVKSKGIETMDDEDIRRLFIRQSEKEYRGMEKSLDALERKVQSFRKGTRVQDTKRLIADVAKLARSFEDIRKRDFFLSPRGVEMKKSIRLIESGLNGLDNSEAKNMLSVGPKQAAQYKGRTWITRKHPFVDRMASAWLIRTFIDPSAQFKFIDERDMNGIGSNTVVFDMKGGEFTHQGDLCTFEVLVKAFNVRDKAVKKVAEIVHDLDLKDDKYGVPETAGVEDILTGIRKTVKNDADALDRGIAVFDMMYRSRTS